MTEPTLQEETLAMLDTQTRRHAAHAERGAGELAQARANEYAYAAECVRRVAALEAEVAALAPYKAFVEAIDRGDLAQVIARRGLKNGGVMLWRDDDRCFDAPTALAAFAKATGGTDA